MKRGGMHRGFLGSRKAVSALIAAVLLLLITFSAVGVIWGGVLPMITSAMQSGQACLTARVSINSVAGFTCYDENKKQINVMVNRGAEEFNLSGIQIGLDSMSRVISYTVRDYKNQILNGNLEIWSNGPNSDPDGWSKQGSNPNTASRESTEKKIGAYSAKIVTNALGSTMLIQQIHPAKGINYWKGRTVTLSAWVKTNSGNIRIIINDGVGTSSATHSGGNNWELLNVTRTISGSATIVEARLSAEQTSATAYFDGVLLVEGSNAKVWGNNEISEILPNKNEANTYVISAENITGVSVAPIVQVGRQENICGITSRFDDIPKCLT